MLQRLCAAENVWSESFISQTGDIFQTLLFVFSAQKQKNISSCLCGKTHQSSVPSFLSFIQTSSCSFISNTMHAAGISGQLQSVYYCLHRSGISFSFTVKWYITFLQQCLHEEMLLIYKISQQYYQTNLLFLHSTSQIQALQINSFLK